MSRRATQCTSLGELIQMAIPLCQAAQQQCPRTGPGRPVEFEDWQMAALIMTAILKKRKSKSSQYSFLSQHRQDLCLLLNLEHLPARSTYFDRYRKAHRLFAVAIRLQGQKALQEHVADASTAAADKSLVAARGRRWHRSSQEQGRQPVGVDSQAAWGRSDYDGWVYGYGYEVLVSATAQKQVFPLLASVGAANSSEHRSFAQKIRDLPASTKHLLLDSGYDSNAMAEAVEWHPDGKPSGRHYLCPLQSRCGKPAVGQMVHRGKRERSRQRRLLRQKYFFSPAGRQLYRLRKQSSEPFNQWFKELFELQDRVWHKGLENNQTQVLCAIFCYQLLIRYNYRRGNRDGQVQWILNGL